MPTTTATAAAAMATANTPPIRRTSTKPRAAGITRKANISSTPTALIASAIASPSSA